MHIILVLHSLLTHIVLCYKKSINENDQKYTNLLNNQVLGAVSNDF
jgi:hypothetical protein